MFHLQVGNSVFPNQLQQARRESFNPRQVLGQHYIFNYFKKNSGEAYGRGFGSSEGNSRVFHENNILYSEYFQPHADGTGGSVGQVC